jgi:hypothetical protein
MKLVIYNFPIWDILTVDTLSDTYVQPVTFNVAVTADIMPQACHQENI